MQNSKKHSPRLKKLLRLIAANILVLRGDRKWTQEEAAERLGCDLRWYQRLESGRHHFSLETLTRLAQLYSVEEKDLLNS